MLLLPVQQSTAAQHTVQADCPPPACSCAKPIGRRIFFAGEHTRADFPGTTNGALLSGQQAARELLKAPALASEDNCVHGVWVRNGTGCVGLAQDAL